MYMGYVTHMAYMDGMYGMDCVGVRVRLMGDAQALYCYTCRLPFSFPHCTGPQGSYYLAVLDGQEAIVVDPIKGLLPPRLVRVGLALARGRVISDLFPARAWVRSGERAEATEA